jgi:hypothetical protein
MAASPSSYSVGYTQGQNDALKQQNGFLQNMMMMGGGAFNQGSQFINSLGNGLMQGLSMRMMGVGMGMGMGLGGFGRFGW